MKKFSTSIYGYNKAEVNAFVAEVAKEYESMLNNLKQRDTEITALKQKLIQYQNMENTLNKALLVAEDASNQIKRMALKLLWMKLEEMLQELLMKHYLEPKN